jgi:uncharacterized membrane protein YkoI
MKIKMIVCSALAMALLTGCVNMKYEGHEHHHKKCEKCEKSEHWKAKQAKLMAEAKVSKETAEQTALAQVPNGTIKEAELEKEHGKLQWSFDIATPASKEITEVNVDAMTGKVISMSKESAEGEAKEGDKDKE